MDTITGNDSLWINLLKKEVEHKAAISPLRSGDFASLAEAVNAAGCGYVSESTLKRIWGYADAGRMAHKSTLSVLSRYVSDMDFDRWLSARQAEAGIDSGFGSAAALRVADLSPSAMVELRWMPDRVVVLRYLGDYMFSVVSSNSRLQEGWILKVSMIVAGKTMIADVATAPDATFFTYEAGHNHGVTWRMI